MLGLGSLSFATPWLLAALLALPVIYWILRITPPAPRRERFPAIAFLFGAQKREETPAHTPLWLLILRMAIAALLIFAFAGPVLNAPPSANTPGPLTLLIDNGWPSARNWEHIKDSALSLIEEAQATGKTVTLIRTAPAAAQSFAPIEPSRAKALLRAMEPAPWLPMRQAVLKAWQNASDAPRTGRIVWLSDGVVGIDGEAFAKSLAAMRTYEVITPALGDLPIIARPARPGAEDLMVTLLRAATGGKQGGSLTAYGSTGKIVSREAFEFAADEAEVQAHFRVPLEIRNEITRVEIDGGKSAGAVSLLDDRWHRRAVGLVSGGALENAQPLLGDLYYVERALQPFADLRKGETSQLIDQRISVLVLADVGRIVEGDVAKLSKWIDDGGVLIRFAGPRLASQSDELVPVRLREGGRVMGGALSWAAPQRLGDFDSSSPFYGLKVPTDISVRRQVLAEPALELTSRTWARLEDGTPLVTGIQRGKGHIVLFHITANSDWSSLPLSGLFVEMLERLVDLSRSAGAAATSVASTATLSPRQVLDGFGVIKPAPASAQPIALNELATTKPGPHHPPGYYGTADAPRALNTIGDTETISALVDWPQNVRATTYAAERVVRLQAPLLVIGLLLAMLDGIAALALMGKLAWRQSAAQTAAILLSFGLVVFSYSQSRADDTALMDAALHTHLAYIVTGNDETDAMSRAGLAGLTERLTDKTALEPDKPVGVDIEKDDITLFPLIYWPVTTSQQPLSADAQRKLDQYLKTGGMILFDTQDEDAASINPGAQTPAALALQTLLQGLDIPELEPVPQNHVLTRSFYLLSDFPGRFAGGRVWVEAGANADPSDDSEAREGAINDGVSSVIIGSNDWAGAWAVDGSGRSVGPVIPGGERQRELAYRFGVNLAMYALTGNYKGDEVHTRELIKRLGE